MILFIMYAYEFKILKSIKSIFPPPYTYTKRGFFHLFRSVLLNKYNIFCHFFSPRILFQNTIDLCQGCSLWPRGGESKKINTRRWIMIHDAYFKIQTVHTCVIHVKRTLRNIVEWRRGEELLLPHKNDNIRYTVILILRIDLE